MPPPMADGHIVFTMSMHVCVCVCVRISVQSMILLFLDGFEITWQKCLPSMCCMQDPGM